MILRFASVVMRMVQTSAALAPDAWDLPAADRVDINEVELVYGLQLWRRWLHILWRYCVWSHDRPSSHGASPSKVVPVLDDGDRVKKTILKDPRHNEPTRTTNIRANVKDKTRNVTSLAQKVCSAITSLVALGLMSEDTPSVGEGEASAPKRRKKCPTGEDCFKEQKKSQEQVGADQGFT